MMNNNKEKNNQNQSEKRRQGVLGLIGGGKRPWVILIFAAVALVLWVLLGSMRTAGSGSAGKSLSTFTVRRDDLTITVTESGSIKASKQIDIKSRVEGRATIITLVPEGSYVTQEDVDNGKVLVELDSSELVERVAQDEIDFFRTEASYTAAQEAYDIQVKQNESDITAGELRVKFALMDFQKYLGETMAAKFVEDVNHAQGANFAKEAQDENPSNPISGISSLLDDPSKLGLCLASQRLGLLNDQIKLTGSRLQKAEYQLEGYQKLYDANYTSEFDLLSQELDRDSAEIQKEQAGISLKLFERYEFPKEAEKLLSDYYEAQRELERTRAHARSRLAQTAAEVKSSKATFDLRKDRLDKRKEQIEACVIVAPAPGLVVYSSSQDFYMGRGRGGGGGSRNIDEGETVYERQKIITLPDTSEMIAEIAVHESSVNMVRPGQRATIVIDAFPDETFQGEVLKVDPLPDPQRGWMNPDLKVYATEVSIEGRHDFLKPGMSAKVEVLVEQLDDVLIVPVQVVANRGGKKVCYYLTPQGPEEREVQTGAFNDTFVHIRAGLEVGEKVLLNPPRLTEASSEDRLKERRKPSQDREQPEGEIPSEGRRPPQGGEPPEGRTPPGDRQPPELTDEVIERVIGRMAENNPEKAQELEQLRGSDPEKFETELRKVMRDRMRQGKKREGRGGDAEVGQNR